MDSRRCMACGELFRPRGQSPQQRYCSAVTCQRERRRRWQRDKRRADPDYRENQARAQQRWREQHPAYWREYRRRHPEYTERNRNAQRARNRRRRDRSVTFTPIAKMDAWQAISPVPCGTYLLRAVDASGIAKMDAWTVQIALVSGTCAAPGQDCKERTL